MIALRARFRDAVVSGSGATVVAIAVGNRLPGTPECSAFAELAWAPAAAWAGFNAGVELVHTGALFVNDANDDAAPAVTVPNLRFGFAQTLEAWRLRQLLRVDNSTDSAYAGSVIAYEANRRFSGQALPHNIWSR